MLKVGFSFGVHYLYGLYGSRLFAGLLAIRLLRESVNTFRLNENVK